MTDTPKSEFYLSVATHMGVIGEFFDQKEFTPSDWARAKAHGLRDEWIGKVEEARAFLTKEWLFPWVDQRTGVDPTDVDLNLPATIRLIRQLVVLDRANALHYMQVVRGDGPPGFWWISHADLSKFRIEGKHWISPEQRASINKRYQFIYETTGDACMASLLLPQQPLWMSLGC